MKLKSVFTVHARSLRARFACVVAVAALTIGLQARADIAVSVDDDALAVAFSNVDITQGWRFSVTQPIQITSLGLLDANQDGFAVDHPIAVWDAAGETLAFAYLESGDVHPLINGFRYADIEKEPVTLLPGNDYTIGYYLPGDAFDDSYIIWNGVHEMHPTIMQVDARFYTLGSELTMPETQDPLGAQCFGPSFQFTIVPGPSAMIALLIAGARSGRRRSST